MEVGSAASSLCPRKPYGVLPSVWYLVNGVDSERSPSPAATVRSRCSYPLPRSSGATADASGIHAIRRDPPGCA